MAGPTDYAAVSDVEAYAPTALQGDEQAFWASALHVASRAIDRYCDRFFYVESVNTLKYFDGNGSRELVIPRQDFFAVTQLQIAYIENASASQWVALSGDGIVPPSDYFLEPANRPFVGQNGDVNVKPFSRISLPEYAPTTSTTFRTAFTLGKRTVSLKASWGWPAVPDEIKDLTVKIVIRMWKAKETNFTGLVGSPDYGQTSVIKYLDVNDLYTLEGFRRHDGGFA